MAIPFQLENCIKSINIAWFVVMELKENRLNLSNVSRYILHRITI